MAKWLQRCGTHGVRAWQRGHGRLVQHTLAEWLYSCRHAHLHAARHLRKIWHAGARVWMLVLIAVSKRPASTHMKFVSVTSMAGAIAALSHSQLIASAAAGARALPMTAVRMI